MAVARCQTAEDGAPRWTCFDTLHRTETGREFVRREFKIRPERRQGGYYAERLVIRHYQDTGDTTVALQGLRVES